MESTKVDRVDSQVRIKIDAVRTVVRSVHGMCPVEPALVTESDEMIAVERLDVGGHGLHPVGDRRRRACS